MSLSFPVSPANGQNYQNWQWNSAIGAWVPNYQNVVGSFNGRGGAVTFQGSDNTPGNRVLLAQTTITTPVASVSMFYDFTNKLFDEMEIDCVSLNAAADGQLQIRFSTDGSTFDSTANYFWGFSYASNTSVGGPTGSNTGGLFVGGVNAGPQASLHRIVVGVPGFADRTKPYVASSTYYSVNAGQFYGYSGGGAWNNQSAIKGIQAVGVTTNLTRGNIAVYGIVKPGSGVQ